MLRPPPRPVLRPSGAALAVALLLAGCGGAADVGGPATAGAPTSPGASPGASPSVSPSPVCAPAPLAQRAAAALVVGIPGVTTVDDALGQTVVDLGVGGLFLSEANVETAEQVSALVSGLRARAGRPLIVSADEESGDVSLDIIEAVPTPRKMARTMTPQQVRDFAREIGTKLRAMGVDVDLAPLLDLDDGPERGVIGARSFSADPDVAEEYGLAFSAGLLEAGITPTVKHFPGHGRSTIDTHTTADVVTASVEELRTSDLAPFQAAIDLGAPVVMLNHLGYAALDGDLPASMSPKAYALLREMGFQGVAITDSIGMGAVNLRWDFPEAAVRAVQAGADAVLATDGNQALRMRDALVAAVQSGRLPEARLSEAAARVTALAGGDPVAMSCLDVELPRLQVPGGAASTATSEASATPAG